MPGLAELAAVIVCAGSALAAVNRNRFFAVLGVAVALVAAPLVGSSAPDLLSLAFREVAVLTGTYLLWISTTRATAERTADDQRPIFPAVVVVVAFLGVVVLAPALGAERGPLAGLAAAAAAGIAALALGMGGRDLLAGGLSAILLVLAASLAVAGLAGVNGPLEHAVIGAALLAVTTAAAFLGGGEPLAPPAELASVAEPSSAREPGAGSELTPDSELPPDSELAPASRRGGARS